MRTATRPMKRRSDKPQSLASGVSLLTLTGLICKVVGVLYRIPLLHSIGAMGVAVYQLVFPSYNLLLTISSAGIPVAISRMVAHHIARQDPRGAKKVFRVALFLLTVLGVISTLLMVLFSGQLAAATGTPESRLGFVMIAPSLFLVCVMSAFRGFMQGQRRMMPTAISQLIEQVGKVGIAIPLAIAGMRRGGYAMGAAGALLGTSLAEAAALIYMMIDGWRRRRHLELLHQGESLLPDPSKLAREMVFIAIPITIGASIVPLAGAADSFMLVNIMKRYMTEMDAKLAYGAYTGIVLTLINVPTALALAMASNLVPAISAGRAVDDWQSIARHSGTGLRLASLVGFPASLGMSLLAEPIVLLLFGKGPDGREALLQAAQLLMISSLTIVVFTQVQATSAILQGLHKQRIPMYTLALGMLLKVIINYTLVSQPGVGISGAPFASLTCYMVSLVPNLYYVEKYGKLKIRWGEILGRPAVATLAMSLLVLGIKAALGDRLNHSWLYLGLTIIAAAALYFVVAWQVKALKSDDLPGFIRRRLT